MANVEGHQMYFSDGLNGQDERLDYLTNLFERLQCATIDACDLDLDLITFAQNSYLFCVILKDPFPQTDQIKEEEDVSKTSSSVSTQATYRRFLSGAGTTRENTGPMGSNIR